MMEVGIEALQDRLADCLERARKGEQIVITDQGRSVALLIPLDESGEPAKKAWELVEAGVASWSGGKPAGARPRPRARGKSASDIVLEDRR